MQQGQEKRAHAAKTYLDWLDTPNANTRTGETDEALAQRKMKFFAALLGVDLSSPQHSLVIQHEIGFGLRELITQHYQRVISDITRAATPEHSVATTSLADLAEPGADTGEQRFSMLSSHDTAKAAELMGFKVDHPLTEAGHPTDPVRPVTMSVGQKSYQSVRSGSSNADFHYEIERTTTSAALPELGVISGNGNCAISVVARAMADAVGCPNVTPLTSDQSGQYIAGTLQPSTLAQTTDIEQIKNNLLEAFNIESIKDNLLQAFNNDQTQMNAYIQNEGFGKDIQRFAQEQAIASTRVFQSAALKSAGHTADTTPVVADHV